MKNIILTCIFCVSINNMYAQQQLTLDDCLSLALKNNAAIKNAQFNIEEAEHGKNNAFTKYFPSVSAAGFGFAANTGLLKTELAPGMGLSLLKNGVIGGVTATQPLFTGGQITNSNKLASLGIDLRKHQMKQSEDEVALTTEQYYWQYLQLNEKLKTIEQIEKLIGNTRKEVEVSVNAGIINRNNLLQVQLKENQIANNRLQIESGIELSKMLLGQYIGLSVDSFSLSVISMDTLVSPTNYWMNFEEIVSGTNTYQMLDKNIQFAQLQTKIERGKYMPSVGVGAAYMYDNLMDYDHSFGMVFATVSIPISGWWGGSHSIRQKKTYEKIAELNKQNTSELMLIQMHQYYKDLEVAYKQIQISQNSIESATENIRLNTDYYKAGTVTLTDLLDAQTLLQQAKDDYVEKYTGYLMKLSKYQKITGVK